MKMQKEWSHIECLDIDEEVVHRHPNEEFAFYQAVGSGDLDAVRRNCEDHRFLDMTGVGKLSKDPLTNLKYHFVVTTAILIRHCLQCGMEIEQAYRLSDFYISKLDEISTLSGVDTLHNRMVMDLAKKMSMMKQNHNASKPVLECIDYIYTHLTDRITIEGLAQAVDLSPSYLSRLFKQEIGISVSEYIRDKKLDRAERLLRYTELSFAEIANILSFSSQSHFIQSFKAYTGITPKKYRDQYIRNNTDTIKQE